MYASISFNTFTLKILMISKFFQNIENVRTDVTHKDRYKKCFFKCETYNI